MVALLAAPLRLALRAVLGLTLGIVGRRQPRKLMVSVAIVTVVVVIVQGTQQHNWAAVFVVSSLAALGVMSPLADAAISPVERAGRGSVR
jgi:hypothetical protein